MIQLYFKLVDKIETGLTLASWKKFKSLFNSKIEQVLSKVHNKKSFMENCKVSLRIFDSMSNSFDFDEMVKNHKFEESWSLTDFLNKGGFLFSLELRIDDIESLIEKEATSMLS